MKRRNAFVATLKEGLVIFTGVLIALLADDWRTRRADNHEAENSLQVIADELLADSAMLASAVSAYRNNAVATRWIFDRRSVSEPARDRVDEALLSLEHFPGLPFSDAGYSGIKAANRLDLLSNDELRRRLVSYYELDQPDLQEYHGIVYDRREALLESMYPYVEHTSFPDEQSVLGVTLRKPWEDLTSDPVVMGRLSRYGASVQALAYDLELLQGQLAEIRTLVGERLED